MREGRTFQKSGTVCTEAQVSKKALYAQESSKLFGLFEA